MSLLNRVQQLPKGFVWGAATAAYQTEGSTKWQARVRPCGTITLSPRVAFCPTRPVIFYNRYEEDIRRFLPAWTQRHPCVHRLDPHLPQRRRCRPSPRALSTTTSCSPAAKSMASSPICPCIAQLPRRPVQPGRLAPTARPSTPMCAMPSSASASSARSRIGSPSTKLISLSHSQYIQGNFPPNHHFDVTSGIQSQHSELVAHARAVSCIRILTVRAPGRTHWHG